MAKIEDVLKKLNKDFDKDLKLWSKVSQEDKDGTFTSTGSVYLDYKLNKKGFKDGLLYLIVGGEGSGKTTLALLAARKYIEKTDKIAVIINGEATTDNSYIGRFNIPEDKILVVNTQNLEEMLNIVESFASSEDVCVIIIDSLPVFFSTVVADKNAEDNTIGIEAKRYNARMPIIFGKANQNKITLLPLTFYKLDPGAMGGDPRKLPRGEWQRYMSAGTIELSKKDIIFDENKKPIGHVVKVRLKKNKLAAFNPKDDFDLNLFYDIGFDNLSDKVKILVEEGIVKQGGAWFELPDGSKKQGMNGLTEFFRDNEEYLEDLYTKNIL
jgi:recombination protein RecA